MSRLRDVAQRIKRKLAPPAPHVIDRLIQEGVVTVGAGTYGVHALTIREHRLPDGRWIGSRLTIGRYCSINEAEIVLGGSHHTEWVSMYPFASMYDQPGRERDGYSKGDVVIGNDVWIAAGAVVLAGVTVGDGAVIAARAVVTKDVRPYAVMAGNPAREVARRFDDETVHRVHAMRWWDWPEDVLRERWPELSRLPGQPAG